MIEINLQKLDRGTKTEWRNVTRDGKTFRQRFKVGTKEVEKDYEVISIDELNKYIADNKCDKIEAIMKLVPEKYGYTYDASSESFFNDSSDQLTFIISDDKPNMMDDTIWLEAIEVNKQGLGHKLASTLKDIAKKSEYESIALEAFPKHNEDDDSLVTGKDIITLVDWWKRQDFKVEYDEDLDDIKPDEEYIYQTSVAGDTSGIDMYIDL